MPHRIFSVAALSGDRYGSMCLDIFIFMIDMVTIWPTTHCGTDGVGQPATLCLADRLGQYNLYHLDIGYGEVLDSNAAYTFI